MSRLFWLDWPAPANVKACYTLRCGGRSQGDFESFNLAQHVGDNPEIVEENRLLLKGEIQQENIGWLNQVHDDEVVRVSSEVLTADANVSNEVNQVCCVMTADCLPVFFCDKAGTQVAVAHAGWRGLHKGILQKTLQEFPEPKEVMVYLGPAISQAAFEVGAEVRHAFLERYPKTDLTAYFVKGVREDKWMADLYGMASALLKAEGVISIYGGDRCTVTEASDFFSYRRDGQTGRMANLIWLVEG